MTDDQEEFKGTDSKSHLTKFQTGGRYDVIEERSEINSPEEQRMQVYNRIWAELVHPVFGLINDFHFRGKIGKDRGARKEIVDMVKSMYELPRGFDSGLPLIEALEYQKEPEKKRWGKPRGGE